MKVNRSPWIHQLDSERPSIALHGDIQTDVAVIGAGIAGVSTSFFLLEKTDKKVVLLDGSRLAHGATGHNAGQITSYFERSLKSISEEFGIEKTKEGQKAIESAWELLDHMYTVAGLSIPIARFLGFAGVIDLERTNRFLEDSLVRKVCGLEVEDFLIADNAPFLKDIAGKFKDLYRIVPHSVVLEKLETHNPMFYGVLFSQKGCMNSALFCQEVVSFLLKKYPQRFSLYEHTHIQKVALHEGYAVLDAVSHTIEAKRVVLCTNGFENIHILNKSGLDIDIRLHHELQGVVGFMSGYLKKYDKPPVAISYIMPTNSPLDGDYIYLTRREYEFEGVDKKNLISIGGPEVSLEDGGEYGSDRDYPEEAQESIDLFAKNFFEKKDGPPIHYTFQWHGLMGYTTSGVRLVGSEPKNPVLLYNLGCNGIGILPSIFGGDRISRIISGEFIKPSIFDPKSEV